MNTLQPLSLAGRTLVPNAERSRYLINILRLSLVMLIFHGFFNLALWLKSEELAPNMTGFALISLIDGAIMLVPNLLLPVFFILWMARSYYNLHRAGLPYLRYSAGWSVGAWFVPLMNFVRPYSIMKEIWIRTQTAFQSAETKARDHSILRYWWILFLSPYAFAFLMGMFMQNMDLTNQQTFHELNFGLRAFSSVFLLLSCYLLISIVKSVSRMEEEFAGRFGQMQLLEVQQAAERYVLENSLAPLPSEPFAFQAAETPVAESKILTGEFVDTKGLAKTMIVCLFILLITTAFTFILDMKVMHTELISDSAQRLFGTVTTLMIMGAVLTVPVLLCTFIVWINRSYNNLRNVRVNGLSISERRQQVWWLIPVINLLHAWNMLREIKKHSQLALTTQEEEPELLPLLDWIWFAFILGALFSWLNLKLTGDGSYAGTDASLAMVLSVLAYLLFIFGFISSIIVTRKISAFQAELFERVEAATDNDTTADYLKTVQ